MYRNVAGPARFYMFAVAWCFFSFFLFSPHPSTCIILIRYLLNPFCLYSDMFHFIFMFFPGARARASFSSFIFFAFSPFHGVLFVFDGDGAFVCGVARTRMPRGGIIRLKELWFANANWRQKLYRPLALTELTIWAKYYGPSSIKMHIW